jgi:hypothetical protein
MDYDKIFMK